MQTRARPLPLSYQILISLGLVLVAGLFVVGLLAFLSAEDEIVETYESQLITSASVLWSLSRDEFPRNAAIIDDQKLPLDAADAKTLKKYARWRSFRIWHDGQLIRATGNAPMPTAPAFAKGFKTITVDGTRWQVYTLSVPEDGLVIEVAEKLAAREKLIGKIVRDLLIPFGVMLPILFILAWFAIQFGLRDLFHLTTHIKNRSARDLSALDTELAPKELLPLNQALNSLMAALERSLHQERLFTDNAAHELRTPLAALKLQAEVIANAADETARRQGVAELDQGISRATRLLDQLLTLARLDHATHSYGPLNLYQQCQLSIIELYPKAMAKNLKVGLFGDEATTINAHPTLIALILNNLLDNAIKYAPNDTEIELHVTQDGFVLTDQGPGIAIAEREKVFGRFYRVHGTLQNGSGLGLSIVKTICDLLGLGITLRPSAENEIGLRVEVKTQK